MGQLSKNKKAIKRVKSKNHEKLHDSGEAHVHSSPNHQSQKNRLNRIRGQIDGIERMIDEGRYCVDIVTQIRAVKSAMAAIEYNILEEHLQHCVHQAFHSQNPKTATEKINEILEIIKK